MLLFYELLSPFIDVEIHFKPLNSNYLKTITYI